MVPGEFLSAVFRGITGGQQFMSPITAIKDAFMTNSFISAPFVVEPPAPPKWRGLFSFPNPVNEKAARSVAALVVLLAVSTLIFRSPVLLWLLALGFLARVASGPRFSPFGLLATRVIAPRLGRAKLVPGPPKRFAQAIGAALSISALISFYLGASSVSWILIAMVVAAATLEAAWGICLGCLIFAKLQVIGLIPASVCDACSDVRLRFRKPIRVGT
jgi:hypothetical protein